MQSNVRYGAASSRAVDGKEDGSYFGDESCMFSVGNYVINP